MAVWLVVFEAACAALRFHLGRGVEIQFHELGVICLHLLTPQNLQRFLVDIHDERLAHVARQGGLHAFICQAHDLDGRERGGQLKKRTSWPRSSSCCSTLLALAFPLRHSVGGGLRGQLVLVRFLFLMLFFVRRCLYLSCCTSSPSLSLSLAHLSDICRCFSLR